ncbi:hypothetical protein [Paenibacillus taichungensis]
MKLTINSILDLPEELRYVLRTIWHPEEGDQFFLLNSFTDPSPVFTYGRYNPSLFAENRLYAYPLLTTERLMKIIEDYGGYQMIREIVAQATSINELFNLLWEKIIYILQDGESPEYWSLTVPVSERSVPEEVEIMIPSQGVK